MLVFAVSDKDGTGQSVTACNLAFHLSLRYEDVAYLDLASAAPAPGSVMEIDGAEQETEGGGLHSYLAGRAADQRRIDVHAARRGTGPRAGVGRLVLLPGDPDGMFPAGGQDAVQRCVELLLAVVQEFDVVVVDVAAGRSAALALVLDALARPALAPVAARWLVLHRWTREHIIAAGDMVHGGRGLLTRAQALGVDRWRMESALRFVRTAVPSPGAAACPARAVWARAVDAELRELASRHRMGHDRVLGEIPWEPLLQWREQVVTSSDVSAGLVGREILSAYRDLADALTGEWR